MNFYYIVMHYIKYYMLNCFKHCTHNIQQNSFWSPFIFYIALHYKNIYTHITVYVLSISLHSYMHIKISSSINFLHPEKISLILLVMNICKKQIFSAVAYLKMLFHSHYLHYYWGGAPLHILPTLHPTTGNTSLFSITINAVFFIREIIHYLSFSTQLI